MTKITIYQNNRNTNKYIEIHNDGHYHNSIRQFLFWKETNVTFYTGDKKLHRWRITNLKELLEDYHTCKGVQNND